MSRPSADERSRGTETGDLLRSCLAQWLLCCSCLAPALGQERLPEPVLTAPQRAWLTERLGIPLDQHLLTGEGDGFSTDASAWFWDHGEARPEDVRFGCLLRRARLEALRSDDPALRIAVARDLVETPLLHRDVRLVTRILLPETVRVGSGIEADGLNSCMDGDTLAEAIGLLPQTTRPMEFLSMLHRSLTTRHVPLMQEASRDPRVVIEDDGPEWTAPLLCAMPLAYADAPWRRSAARFLLDEGRLRPTVVARSVEPRSVGGGLSVGLVATLTDSGVLGSLGDWGQFEGLACWLLQERAGALDVDVARVLLAADREGAAEPKARRLAMRILADAGHRPLLAAHTEDPDPVARTLAQLGLAKSGDAAALARLQELGPSWALAEADPRSWAERTVGRAAGDEALLVPTVEDSFDQMLRLPFARLGAELAGQAVAQCLPAARLLELAESFPEARTGALADTAFERLEEMEPEWAAFALQGSEDWFSAPDLDLLELRDRPRLVRLLRRWAQVGCDQLRQLACRRLLELGDPGSAAMLVGFVRERAGDVDLYSRSNGVTPWDRSPWMLLTRSEAPAVREFLGELARADLRGDDSPAPSVWPAIARLGGLSERDASLWLSEFSPHDDWDGRQLPESCFDLLLQFRAVDAFVEWLETMPDSRGFTEPFGSGRLEVPPLRLRDPRILEVARARYDRGQGVSAFVLASLDPDRWAREVDSALHAGWYGYFNGINENPTNDLDLFLGVERLDGLLDLTESNYCLFAVVNGLVDELVDPVLGVRGGSESRDLPLRRARLRALLPRLRWSSLVERLVVMPG